MDVLKPECSELSIVPLEAEEKVAIVVKVAKKSHKIELSRCKDRFKIPAKQRIGTRRWRRWQRGKKYMLKHKSKNHLLASNKHPRGGRSYSCPYK